MGSNSSKNCWNGQDHNYKDKMEKVMSSVTETIKEMTSEAADSVENISKCWSGQDQNYKDKMEKVMSSVTETIKEMTSEAADSVENIAKSTWEDLAAGASTTTEKVENWWSSINSEKKKEGDTSGNENCSNKPTTESCCIDTSRGVVVGMAINAYKYIVTTSGRRCNILIIYTRNNLSSLGNPRWWVRYDRPHGNVNYHHININELISGFKDPHTPISPITAKFVEIFGKIAEIVNKCAWFFAIAAVILEVCWIAIAVWKDYEHGTKRNTIEALATAIGAHGSGFLGALLGASLGTWIAPGLGTIFGGVIGGALGGLIVGYCIRVAVKWVLDHFEVDIATVQCAECDKEFVWRKYQKKENVCDGCAKSEGLVKFLLDKLRSTQLFLKICSLFQYIRSLFESNKKTE